MSKKTVNDIDGPVEGQKCIVRFTSVEADIYSAEVADHCYFDGYSIAERLMEGVPLKVTLTEDKMSIDVTGIPNNLNVSKYTKEAVEFALQYDVFGSDETMSDDDCAIVVYQNGVWEFNA